MAARGEKPDITPVWLMRQAGRYLPEYLELRSKHSFLDVCYTPELATEVTLQPIRRFDFDASILFSDILVPLVPMGAELTFGPGHGPQIANKLRTDADIKAMKPIEPQSDLKNVLDAVRMIRRDLPESTPLIGFAGAPFTLASYWVEGGKPDPFANLKSMLYQSPEIYARMMDSLSETVSSTLAAMVEAGADAVQVFDTWGGILSEREYRAYNLPFLKKVFTKLKSLNVPLTYYVKDGSHLVGSLREIGANIIGVDWRLPLPIAHKALGDNITLQGNLDPTVLFGDEKTIRTETRRILDESVNMNGHIFNLGHGILPKTPIAAVECLLDEIRCK